jgi:putative ABC transport system permease protein
MKLTIFGFLGVAFSQLKRNKGRSFLTMLGIIIGVGSVVMLVAIGNGLKVYIQQQFEDLGANTVFIMPGQVFKSGQYRPGSDLSSFGGAKFDEDDIKNIAKVPSVLGVSPLVVKSSLASRGKKQMLVEITGVSHEFLRVRRLNLSSGRFFTKAEDRRGGRVVVLGSQVQEDLFGSVNSLGKKIDIEGEKYRVIGIVEKLGGIASMGGGFDSRVYLPFKAAFKITGEKDFPIIILAAKDREMLEQVKSKTRKVLLKRYDDEDFSIVDQAEILTAINNVLSMLTVGLAGIAAISLLVGGVGIMNIMFVSVTERIKEIGLRKAVGASSKDILLQFLLESVVLSFSGGVMGVLLSILAVLVIRSVFPATITYWSVFLAFGVSTLIGVIFGVAPARRAAKLSPIDALRYE